MNLIGRTKVAFSYLRTGKLPLDAITKKSYVERPEYTGSVNAPTRDQAMEYVPFARCINLISSGGADLIKKTLKVVDDETGELSTIPRSKDAVKMLVSSPDGIHSSTEFFRDVIGDYLIDGNALIHVVRESGVSYNKPVRLERVPATTASTLIGDPVMGLRSLVYRGHVYGDNTTQTFPARDIVHAKFGQREAIYSGSNGRAFFSKSGLSMLARAISIGKRTDAYIDRFFDEASQNDLAVIFPHESSGGDYEERNMESFHLHKADKRSPWWLFGDPKVQTLGTTPQSADALALREYGVQEIGRFYGIPAPLINLNVTQWGSGIEQLAKLHYRYGLRVHIDPILDALSYRLLPYGLRFEVDPIHEVKGDMGALSTFVSAMRPSTNNPGVMSKQEVRDMIGARGEYVDDWGWKPSVSAGMRPSE